MNSLKETTFEGKTEGESNNEIYAYMGYVDDENKIVFWEV